MERISFLLMVVLAIGVAAVESSDDIVLDDLTLINTKPKDLEKHEDKMNHIMTKLKTLTAVKRNKAYFYEHEFNQHEDSRTSGDMENCYYITKYYTPYIILNRLTNESKVTVQTNMFRQEIAITTCDSRSNKYLPGTKHQCLTKLFSNKIETKCEEVKGAVSMYVYDPKNSTHITYETFHLPVACTCNYREL